MTENLVYNQFKKIVTELFSNIVFKMFVSGHLAAMC